MPPAWRVIRVELSGEDSSASGATIISTRASSAAPTGGSARGSSARPPSAAPAVRSAGALMSAVHLPALGGEALQGAPRVAVFGLERLDAAGEVVERVGGGQPVFGRSDAQGDRAAAAGAVDPVRLRVGALDRLQP